MYTNILDNANGYRYCVLFGMDDSNATSIYMCRSKSDVVVTIAEHIMDEFDAITDDGYLSEDEPDLYNHLTDITNNLGSSDIYEMISIFDNVFAPCFWVTVIDLEKGKTIAFRREAGNRTIISE